AGAGRAAAGASAVAADADAAGCSRTPVAGRATARDFVARGAFTRRQRGAVKGRSALRPRKVTGDVLPRPPVVKQPREYAVQSFDGHSDLLHGVALADGDLAVS